LRLNTHLGVGGVISTGRIHDPERATAVILSYKTAAGDAIAIARKNIKIVCFAYAQTCRL